MNINRSNYEEYFFLALDKELDPLEQMELEKFLTENPDLKKEWIQFSSNLVLDNQAIRFENKSELYLIPKSKQIHEALLCFIDDELNPEAVITTKKLIAEHPSIEQEFNQLLKTKLKEERSIHYPWKNSLYKKDKPVLPLFLFRVAASILLILGFSWLWFNQKASPTFRSNFAATKFEQIPLDSKLPQKSSLASIPAKTALVNTSEENRFPLKLASETIKQNKSTYDTSSSPSEEYISFDNEPMFKPGNLHTALLDHNASLTNGIATNIEPGTIHPVLYTEQPSFELEESENDSNDAIQILITDTNKRNKSRFFVRKLVRIADKISHFATASSEESKNIQIASFEFAIK